MYRVFGCFSSAFYRFQKESFNKSVIFRSPASRRLGLERPGLQKSSISFKFLLKIADFRRRVDSERPGLQKSSISFKFLGKIGDFRRRVDSERPGLHISLISFEFLVKTDDF